MTKDKAFQAPQSLENEIAELRTQVDALRCLALAGKRIDLVDFNAYKVFMFTDDLAYEQVHERYRHAPTNKEIYRKVGLPQRTVESLNSNLSTPLMYRVLGHYWSQNLDFVYIDVGCQYGTSAIFMALMVESYGKPNRVIAFEPGIAGMLVPFNLEINSLQDKVMFQSLAVSDGSYPTILFGESGHSENNRIVNRHAPTETMSCLVRTVSIDEFVEAHGIDQNLILKIDTQGAEYEVLTGMRRVMRDRNTTFAMEFTPWALATRVNPSAWLRELAQHYHVIDTEDMEFSERSEPFLYVDAGQCEKFTEKVSSRPSKYTDILAIPRTLPAIDELLSRIVNHPG